MSCFTHHNETFSEVNDHTKKELLDVIKFIEDTYKKHEEKIAIDLQALGDKEATITQQ